MLGSLLALGMGALDTTRMAARQLSLLWQWKMTVLMLPILLYGFLLFGQKFPVQERVEAGVSYREMLAELGWGGGYVVWFLLIMGIQPNSNRSQWHRYWRNNAPPRANQNLSRLTRGVGSRNRIRPCMSAPSAAQCSSSCCS